VELFWIVTPYNVVVGYQRFRGLCSLQMEAAWTSETLVAYYITRRHNPEDGGSMYLWDVGILPQHYTASESLRPRSESSPPSKPQNSHQEEEEEEEEEDDDDDDICVNLKLLLISFLRSLGLWYHVCVCVRACPFVILFYQSLNLHWSLECAIRGCI
jgi:hypothetical protein